MTAGHALRLRADRARYTFESNGDLPRAPARRSRPRSTRSTPPDARDAARRRRRAPLLLDVREHDEWDEGHIPGARPRPARQPRVARSRRSSPTGRARSSSTARPAHRSAFAAKTLEELGYDERRLAGRRLRRLEAERLPDRSRRARSTPEQRARYSRHLLIPEVGEEGQQKLLDVARAPDRRRRARLARRRSTSPPPASARSGSSTTTSSTSRTSSARSSTRPSALGEPKVDSAKRTIEALNPDVDGRARTRSGSTSENVERILADGWDVIVDGADNFPTRYLVNDASVWHGIPVVHGSIYRFEGQVDRLQARRRARATAASSRSRRRRSSRRAAPRAACSASCPASSARSRRARRSSSRSASASRSSAGCCSSTRSHTTFDEVSLRRDPDCPVCGDAPDDHRVHRLRRVLRRAPVHA